MSRLYYDPIENYEQTLHLLIKIGEKIYPYACEKNKIIKDYDIILY